MRDDAVTHPKTRVASARTVRREVFLTGDFARFCGTLALLAILAAPAYAQGPWTITDLGTLGGPSSSALDVNDSGQVVGWAFNAAGQQRAFVWTPANGMLDLGTLGGPSSSAHAINNAGQIVGESTTGSGQNHAFLWTAAGAWWTSARWAAQTSWPTT